MKDKETTGPGRRALLGLTMAAAILLGQGSVAAQAAKAEVKSLAPVGRAVGMKLFSDGVLVVGFSQIPAAQGSVVPAKSCGLKEGDIITHINASEVDTIEEVQQQLQVIGGEEMSIRPCGAASPSRSRPRR